MRHLRSKSPLTFYKPKLVECPRSHSRPINCSNRVGRQSAPLSVFIKNSFFILTVYILNCVLKTSIQNSLQKVSSEMNVDKVVDLI